VSRFRVGLMDSILAGRPSRHLQPCELPCGRCRSRRFVLGAWPHQRADAPAVMGPEVHRGGTSVAIARRGDGRPASPRCYRSTECSAASSSC